MAILKRTALTFLLSAGLAAIPSAVDVQPGPAGVLISRQLMKDAHLAVGDEVVLAVDPAGTQATTFRIAGVYEPTPDPMKFNVERLEVRLHLPDLVAMTAGPAGGDASEAVSALNVKLRNPADAETFGSDVSRRSMGLLARPTARAREGDPFAVLERFHQAIAAVTVVGSTAFLLALMVIRAEERRETVGMLRLIGISRQSIIREILIEGLAVALAGALFGVLFAAIAQYGINSFFEARYDTPLLFARVTWSIAVRCLLVAVPIGIVTGAVASWTLLRRPPVELMGR